MNPYLSIIIPAYNEADRLEKTLVSIGVHLKQKEYVYEIIVVNDGSVDDTQNLLEDLVERINHLKIIKFLTNQGKGAAVKAGMLSAKGEVVLFMDADGSTSITEIDKLIPFIENGFDIVAGSRIIEDSQKKIKQSYIREFLGWVYRVLVHFLVDIDVKDTQNGFKLFSKKAAKEIFSSIEVKGWSFDVEIFLIAKKMNYLVKEMPIIWVNDKRSRISFHQMLKMLLDLLRIYRKYDN